MKKFYTCRYDVVFKAVVCNNEDKRILKAILKSIFNKEYDDIEILNSEMLKPNIQVKSKTVDLLLKDKDTTIIVELNSTHRNPSRNFAYLCNEIATRTKVGEEYDTNYQFYQINLSYNLKDEEEIRTYYMQDEKIKKFVDNVCIIEYNMNKLKKYYEEGNEDMINKYQYLIMLDLDKEELNTLKKKDEVVMEYEKKVTEINNSEEYVPYLTVEEDNRKFMNTIIRESKEEGIQQGLQQGMQQGMQQGIIKSIKSFYENGASLELIAKSNDMTIEEVKELLKDKEE